MALSRIWTAFIVIALLAAAGRFLFQPGQEQIFSNLVTGKNSDTVSARTVDSALVPVVVKEKLNGQKLALWGKEKVYRTTDGQYRAFQILPANGVFETTKDAVNLSISLIGIMALFIGLMAIAEKAGGIRFLSRIIAPFFTRIFPDVPKDHPSMGHMVMNFSANLLGLDNAATPFGIKAMESLQEINPDKTTASNAQLMFLCLHASGLTLIPTVIIADRVALKSQHPTDIFIPCMIATFVATIAALLIVALRQRIRIFQTVILLWVLGISMLIAALLFYVRSLDADGVKLFSGSLSNGLILLIIVMIVAGGIYKKINVFEAFIDGAKGGFEIAVKIIPYLVGLLVAISLLRNSGVLDFALDGLKNLFILFNGDTRIVDGLPTAILKPLSGSGARAMMIDTLNTHGADSFAGNLASIFRGSADTTFYIIAVYFGAVGIKNTRYAVGTMLLADLAGIITSIILAYIFFG